jgi:hypothetical protein
MRPLRREVGDVGAGHDPARGLVELLARPPAPVRAAVGIEEELEPLAYVHSASPNGARFRIRAFPSIGLTVVGMVVPPNGSASSFLGPAASRG